MIFSISIFHEKRAIANNARVLCNSGSERYDATVVQKTCSSVVSCVNLYLIYLSPIFYSDKKEVQLSCRDVESIDSHHVSIKADYRRFDATCVSQCTTALKKGGLYASDRVVPPSSLKGSIALTLRTALALTPRVTP